MRFYVTKIFNTFMNTVYCVPMDPILTLSLYGSHLKQPNSLSFYANTTVSVPDETSYLIEQLKLDTFCRRRFKALNDPFGKEFSVKKCFSVEIFDQ